MTSSASMSIMRRDFLYANTARPISTVPLYLPFKYWNKTEISSCIVICHVFYQKAENFHLVENFVNMYTWVDVWRREMTERRHVNFCNIFIHSIQSSCKRIEKFRKSTMLGFRRTNESIGWGFRMRRNWCHSYCTTYTQYVSLQE